MSAEIYKARFDAWCCVYDAYQRPGVNKRVLGVSRGMNDFYEACSMARIYSEWALQHGVENPVVFVVHGPTSTTRCKYEVTDASAGYTIEFRINAAQLSEET